MKGLEHPNQRRFKFGHWLCSSKPSKWECNMSLLGIFKLWRHSCSFPSFLSFVPSLLPFSQFFPCAFFKKKIFRPPILRIKEAKKGRDRKRPKLWLSLLVFRVETLSFTASLLLKKLFTWKGLFSSLLLMPGWFLSRLLMFFSFFPPFFFFLFLFFSSHRFFFYPLNTRGHLKKVTDFVFQPGTSIGYSCGGEHVIQWDLKTGSETG